MLDLKLVGNSWGAIGSLLSLLWGPGRRRGITGADQGGMKGLLILLLSLVVLF